MHYVGNVRHDVDNTLQTAIFCNVIEAVRDGCDVAPGSRFLPVFLYAGVHGKRAHQGIC